MHMLSASYVESYSIGPYPVSMKQKNWEGLLLQCCSINMQWQCRTNILQVIVSIHADIHLQHTDPALLLHICLIALHIQGLLPVHLLHWIRFAQIRGSGVYWLFSRIILSAAVTTIVLATAGVVQWKLWNVANWWSMNSIYNCIHEHWHM